MQALPKLLFAVALTLTLTTIAQAAEPKTIEDLRNHFSQFNDLRNSFKADFTITVNPAQDGKPRADELAMDGYLVVQGIRFRTTMLMDLGAGSAGLTMETFHDRTNKMYTLMKTPGYSQLLQMDIDTVAKLSDGLGVPSSALNNGNMDKGMLQNPARILDVYTDHYDLTLAGKQQLGGEDVYRVTAQLKDEALANLKAHTIFDKQIEVLSAPVDLYIGADDGVLRKATMGTLMAWELKNINFKTSIDESDFKLELPEGLEMMDMTDALVGTFSKLVTKSSKS